MRPLLTALLAGVIFHLRLGQCCTPVGMPMGAYGGCPGCAPCGPLLPRPVECRCPLPTGTPHAFSHGHYAIQCNSYLAPYQPPPPLPPHPLPPPMLPQVVLPPLEHIPYLPPPPMVMPEGTTLLHLKPPPHPPNRPESPKAFTPLRITTFATQTSPPVTYAWRQPTTTPVTTTAAIITHTGYRATETASTYHRTTTTAQPVEHYLASGPILVPSPSPATALPEVTETTTAPYSIYGDQLCIGDVQARSFEPNVSMAAEKCSRMGCAAVNLWEYHDEYHDRSNSNHFEYSRGQSHSYHHDNYHRYGSNSDHHRHHMMEAVYMRRVDSRQHSSGHYCMTSAEVPLRRSSLPRRQHGLRRVGDARKQL